MTTTDTKNPLRRALDDIAERGNRSAVRALVDATDRALERHQIHAWARPDGFPPDAADRAAIDTGLRRLGLRRGLPEATWTPWIRAVKARRRQNDRRLPEVRAAAGLPPRAYTGGRGRVRASESAPAEAAE